MVRVNSLWVKFPVTLLLILAIATLFIVEPSSNNRAVAIIGLILLTEAYFLGVDSSIVNRIVKMKPLNAVINGLYYIVLGVTLVIVMTTGAFAFFQWSFAGFLCLVGASILIYQVVKGSKWTFRDVEGAAALRQVLEISRRAKFEARLQKKLEERRDEKATPPQLAAFEADQRKKFEKRAGKGGLRPILREYMVYVYLVSIGSDLSVATMFLAIFALMNYVTAILLFILGYFIKVLGDQIAKRVGVVKEVSFTKETAFK